MQIKQILGEVNARLASREMAATQLELHSDLLNEAIRIIQNPEHEYSLNALYSLEVLGRKNFSLVARFIPVLADCANSYTNSSARRCLAKIFSFTTEEMKEANSQFQPDQKTLRQILETSFTWLISHESTAVKVFSMQCIYDLKENEDWVETELKAILEKELPNSSPGYRSRAVKILRKLNK